MLKKCRKCKIEKELNKFTKMQIGKYGVASTCIDCNNNKAKNNYKPLKTIKPVKKVSKKRAERLKAGLTERSVFEKVSRNNKKCFVCDKYIAEDLTYTFPHILPKGTYPELRLFSNNIQRVCSIEHHNIFDALVNYNHKNQIQSKRDIRQDILDGKPVIINKNHLHLFL